MGAKKRQKKIPITTVTLLTILFVNLLIICAETTSWSPATQLTFEDPAWDTDPSIVQTTDGTIWVAWASDRVGWKNDIYYKTSSDNGVSWTDDTQLTYDAEQDITPSIIQTADGTIWVVWASDRTENFELFYTTSDNNGASWAPETQLTTNPTRDGNPSIMQHHNGTIWVVWHRDMGAGNYDLFYKTSPDNGSTWSPEKRLTTDPSWDLHPSIIQAYDETIWIVWTSYRTDNYEIFCKTSTDNGTSWSPETQLTTNKGFNEAPSITQGGDGSLWVVWHSDRKGTQYDVYCKTSTDNGASWSSDFQLTTDNADDMSPTIMNSHEGRIWIAWTSARIGDQFDLFYTTSDIIPTHDVAITSVTPSTDIVHPGEIVNIDVVAKNEGTQAETFDVTAYYNTNIIETQTVTNLAPHMNITLTFNWNTTDVQPCINYTIKAEASAVPGEIDTIDNTFTDGTVLVTFLSDIRGPAEPDHPPDGKVDMWDFEFIALSYGKTEADPDWNIYKIADIRGPESPEGSGLYPPDGVVDIWDLGYCGLQYGETCYPH